MAIERSPNFVLDISIRAIDLKVTMWVLVALGLVFPVRFEWHLIKLPRVDGLHEKKA